jgi:TfuA protein
MPNVVVFLGPSLPEAEAREILDADYRPPAKRGDLFKAAKDGAEVICLIDGVFFQECSVAHKEVLYALDHGVKVIGASSMGALRASELDVYGMQGVGEIYEAYKCKELISDDEVALIFDPYSLEPLSEPLVNIRHNLKIAMKEGVLDEESSLALLQEAMSLYFPDRTYDRIINACKGRVAEELLDRFKSFIDTKRSDLKKEDAIRALRRARELADEARSQDIG